MEGDSWTPNLLKIFFNCSQGSMGKSEIIVSALYSQADQKYEDESQSLLTQPSGDKAAPMELEVTSQDSEECMLISWDHDYVLPDTQLAVAKK